uniref:Uncharacterized protein n=1 Tax=Gossypium raimondii TaxID=29730 RepID=A0A0D2R2Y8_GOSRA|nr:hypothetical protein B456_010G061700 [Gossypium raimondii]
MGIKSSYTSYTTIPQTESVKENLTFVEKRFHYADKPLTGTFMAQFMTMKFNGSRGMLEHIIKMTNIAAKLKILGITIDDSFLLQFILNLTPPNYGHFIPNNTWGFNSGSTTHVSKFTQRFLMIQTTNPNEHFLYMRNRMKALIEGIGTYGLLLDICWDFKCFLLGFSL